MADESKPTLEQKLTGWVERSGFALELRVARALIRAGADKVTPSDYYYDPLEQKWREIDVTAQFSGIRGVLRWRINVAIECKSSKRRPWVVLVDSNRYDTSTEAIRRMLIRADNYADVEAVGQNIRGLAPFPTDVPAHTIVEALRGTGEQPSDSDGPNVPFRAVRQAASGAVALQSDEPEHKPGIRLVQFTLPVVVTAAPLFRCSLDGEGNLHFDAVPASSVYVQVGGTALPTPVQVMSEQHFVSEWAPAMSELNNWISAINE